MKLKVSLTLAMLVLGLLIPQSSSAQFSFRFNQSTTELLTLDQAMDLLAGQNVASEQRYEGHILDLVDANNFAPGRFQYDLNLLGDPSLAQDFFAIEIVAELEILAAGTYTFGMNMDDGGRLDKSLGVC